MNFITDFQTTWANPQMRHALLLHWPIVLSVLAALFAVAMAFNQAHRTWLRWVTLLCCLATLATGFMTKNSGEAAEHSPPVDVPAARATLHEHEELGEKVPLIAAIGLALTAISFVPKKSIRLTAAWLAAASCAFSAMWIGNTAHYGGLLVYKYGLGTPKNADAVAPERDTGSASATTDPQLIFFRERILPALESNCARCHNPSKVADNKSGLLDLTSSAGFSKGGKSGPIVIAGKPEESLLIRRIHATNPDDLMPPPPNDKLPDDVIADFERWIREGAKWDDSVGPLAAQ